MEILARSPARISSEWNCTICGAQKFEKDADPINPPAHPAAPLYQSIGCAVFLFALVGAYLLVQSARSLG